MDEEVDRLFGVIRRLRAQGGGIVYISHRLEEVFAISDRDHRAPRRRRRRDA